MQLRVCAKQLHRLFGPKVVKKKQKQRRVPSAVENLLENLTPKCCFFQGVPLHGAAEYGSVDAARTLIEHGANVNISLEA